MMTRKGLPAEYTKMAEEMARWLVHHLEIRDKAMVAHERMMVVAERTAEQEAKERKVTEDLLDWLAPEWRCQIGMYDEFFD